MATLSTETLVKLRQENANNMAPDAIDYTKTDINSALQALEDWFDDPLVRTEVSDRIDTATSPFVFTAAQKKKIAKYWLRSKFGRE